MSRSKYIHSTFSGLIDSDSEDTELVQTMPTPDSAAENRAPGRKARGRPKTAPAKVTKTKVLPRRLSGRLMAKAKASDPVPAKQKRKALADKTNHQYETEEVDEFEQNEDVEMADELDAALVPVKEKKPQPTKKGSTGRGLTKKKVSSKCTAAMGHSLVVPESQVPQMEIKNPREEEDIERPISKPVETSLAQERPHPRQPSKQRRRAGSTSDTERSDPVLRRKLGEMTKKYDSLNVKYQDLREIGLKEAERNFERLKKQSEQDKAAAEKLIASLKEDAVATSSLDKESRELRKKVQSQAVEISRLQTQIVNLTASLGEAQLENKTLSTKITVNRIAAAEIANIKAPCTAVKSNGAIRATGVADTAAQLKENLYSDLTGLIIRSVKQEADEDVFDCIQTGRNGTLHFKLAVTNDKNESYDDATCSYVPQLDPSRDRDLMELLPDYLVEEITFPRPQAARFYARVVKALTEQ